MISIPSIQRDVNKRGSERARTGDGLIGVFGFICHGRFSIYPTGRRDAGLALNISIT